MIQYNTYTLKLLINVYETEFSVCVSHSVRLFVTPWTLAHQAPLSMDFSRQEYWSGLPFPPPGHLPDPGIELRSPALGAYSLPSDATQF